MPAVTIVWRNQDFSAFGERCPLDTVIFDIVVTYFQAVSHIGKSFEISLQSKSADWPSFALRQAIFLKKAGKNTA